MRIAFVNWRDSTHPEGGGAEKYAETVCAGLAARGHDVTLLCARHPGSAAVEQRDGIRMYRQGGRLTVYPASLRRLAALERAGGRFDVVVDTQNGVPFWTPLATRAPVVVLVHHVHREQWPIALGPVAARVGWFLESQVAPRTLRGHQYVAVSDVTRTELAELGVDPSTVAVIRNGTEPPRHTGLPRSPEPRLVVLGRVVPHKRVEHALAVVAALAPRWPELRLRVVGHGWWMDEVREEAHRLGVSERVDLLGFVDDDTKHRELAAAWLALAPSVKEGWGLSVVEAAAHRTPTVAYRQAGGLAESIHDGETGVLVDDLDELTETTERLLTDGTERERLGREAAHHALGYTWEATVRSWEDLLTEVVSGRTSPAATNG
ncbi:glycosyltransferase family 4 protein [Phycicoccus sp. CSK15P-2]|uniref:glycosyltransferase family 4 protein n=1 Tax=Phycicoccus sp. CSK15P-2 TaxID=2807627 RepID=UPI0019529844|nr:glycosyltransferase family 4 protein [Phycicoccus sp. CSK15P-2]MBM6403796.1 glycosyltransferase family 4 protein [Phycicoccus sp. CSK15P-2]